MHRKQMKMRPGSMSDPGPGEDLVRGRGARGVSRSLEPSADPTEIRSALVAYLDPRDLAARAELVSTPRQRSLGSVIEDFVRHKDRKYTLDSKGNAHRGPVLARKRNVVGLGKEANRFEPARVLGVVRPGRAKVCAP